MRTRSSIRGLTLVAVTIAALLAGTVSAAALPVNHHHYIVINGHRYKVVNGQDGVSQAMYGSVCRDGDSNTGQEGRICVAVGADNNGKTFWGIAFFQADTNTLKEVAINHLHSYLEGVVVQHVDFESNVLPAGTTQASIDTPEDTVDSPKTAYAGVYNACEYWNDGSHWCTATSAWFYSDNVTVG